VAIDTPLAAARHEQPPLHKNTGGGQKAMNEPLNPYAPPQILDQPQARLDTHPALARPYVSAQGKTTALVWLSSVDLALQAVTIGSLFMQLSMLYLAQGDAGLTQEAADANDLRQQVVAGFLVVALVVTFIALLVWVYATHANLPALGAGELEFSSGWAVGWFFVPLANLIQPYKAVSEIWHRSQPNPLLGMANVGGHLVGWWWFLRVISGIAERGLNAFGRDADTIDSLIVITWAGIILTAAIDAPMSICQILMARRVQRFQDQRHELVLQNETLQRASGDNPFAM
jgi:hypothetical protein